MLKTSHRQTKTCRVRNIPKFRECKVKTNEQLAVLNGSCLTGIQRREAENSLLVYVLFPIEQFCSVLYLIDFAEKEHSYQKWDVDKICVEYE
jgi:hypothetical protein